MSRLSIWWWQRIVSPHMAGLAAALAARGCEVTYVAEQPLSANRARDGWRVPDLPGVRLELVDSRPMVADLIRTSPVDSVHICQGLRANGQVGEAQRLLARRGSRQWVIMETVDDAGWRGVLRRLEYGRLFRRRGGALEGVLAIGYRTPGWVCARNMSAAKVFPFAYFLPRPATSRAGPLMRAPGRYRFVYAGQLIEQKRVGVLLQALAALGRQDVELVIVGDGPLRAQLQGMAAKLLPGRVQWLGRCPMDEVPMHMAAADCLVLPSRHDGWGAVISEALMVGTPVICSAACGAAGVVRASGAGGVFEDADGLSALLRVALDRGPVNPASRIRLAAWTGVLAAEAGADYLLAILDHAWADGVRPSPPWQRGAPGDGRGSA